MQQAAGMTRPVPVLTHTRNQEYCGRCTGWQVSKGSECVSYAADIAVSEGASVDVPKAHVFNEFEKGPPIVL